MKMMMMMMITIIQKVVIIVTQSICYTEKYIGLSVPIQKENENGMAATYKITFIDSVRFMENSLSNLADNLYERFHKDKMKRS